MSENGEMAAPAPASKSEKKTTTIENQFRKISHLEYILLHLVNYIGPVKYVQKLMWIFDKEKNHMVQKQMNYVPGLFKIFEEILLNAADHKQHDRTMDCIKIEINQELNVISVWNNGQGIPVVMHEENQMFLPTLIFGHLMTSSNYDDNVEKMVSGRHGYAAKLCNICSTKFTVETATIQYSRQFKQTWEQNMTKMTEPKLEDFGGNDFTKITFSPDLSKFGMEKLDDNIVQLMSRKAYDIAASTRGVKVFLNGEQLQIKNFKDYIDLYLKGRYDIEQGTPKVVYENVSDRWEIGVTVSDENFQHISFVNSVATTRGGTHVDYVTDMIVKQLLEVLKKKNKCGINIQPYQVKNHMWIFLNCLIINPEFDSCTKENMITPANKFGSKCEMSEKFIRSIAKSGIVETVLLNC